VQFFPDSASNFRQEKDFQHLSALAKRLDSLVVSAETNVTSLEFQRDAIVEKRTQVRQRIIEILNKIDDVEIQELNGMVDKLINALRNDLNRCKKERQELTNLFETTESNAVYFPTAFIAYIECLKKVPNIERLCDAVVKRGHYSVECHVNPALEEFANSLQSIGTLEGRVTLHPDHVYKVTHSKKNVIKFRNDMRRQTLIDVLELPDGKIVAGFCDDKFVGNDISVDNLASLLVLLDQSFNTLCINDIKGPIISMSHTIGNTFVVSIGERISYISVNSITVKKRLSSVETFEFKQTKSIPFGHKCICVAYHSDNIYVLSGQALYKYTGDGEMVKKLYETMTGEDTTGTCNFDSCALSNDGSIIFITDYVNDLLITVDNQGNHLATLKDVEMEEPLRVHVMPSGHVLVSCLKTVLQISQDGDSTVGTLLSDEAIDPLCVIYHHKKQRLLIGCYDYDKVIIVEMAVE